MRWVRYKRRPRYFSGWCVFKLVNARGGAIGYLSEDENGRWCWHYQPDQFQYDWHGGGPYETEREARSRLAKIRKLLNRNAATARK